MSFGQEAAMADLEALRALRDQRFFDGWDGYLAPELVQASDEALRHLVDGLITLGERLRVSAARRLVDECVHRFNELDLSGDHHWICTIEREDIFEQVGRAVELCGFEYDEDWLDEREW
jgi:hypothetical protein